MSKSEHYFQPSPNEPAHASVANPEGTSASSIRTNHILVVDDNSSVRETRALVLATKQYDVSTAKDGLDALLQLKSAAPDLLLCDLEMPRMSGFELLSVVRRRFPAMGVIAMSGSYESELVPAGVLA